MSAMPIRTPRTKYAASRRKHLALVKTASAPLVQPIAAAIPMRIPQTQASKRVFGFIVSGFAVLGLLCTLLVNTLSAQASFEKHALQSQLAQLNAEQESLERLVSSLESPENITRAALKMGMVPAESPAFIRLSDRKVLGRPMAAGTQGR